MMEAMAIGYDTRVYTVESGGTQRGSGILRKSIGFISLYGFSRAIPVQIFAQGRPTVACPLKYPLTIYLIRRSPRSAKESVNPK